MPDKINKNHRKTLGLMRDLQARFPPACCAKFPNRASPKSRARGRGVRVVPSTNPGATPANNIINALKCGNAVILSPSPKGVSTSAKLLEYIHVEFKRINAPPDLVQDAAQPGNQGKLQRN